MAEVVVQVEHLSKLYQLGAIGTGSLRQDIQRWWTTSLLKKEDPFFHADPKGTGSAGPNSSLLWALRDINFEVKQGEVMGIIGNNGSGKSTLLKILSRIVRPTCGAVRGKGKISSLLEVGTGFNPDLTGRENIYMSGYILGMKRQEVQEKFDEIVAFSGIEDFIDTPVKRYSSGMYTRLAFAVAAHLEPDILIIDEVLAVGDVEFQKKCLGKMEEASQQDGRTILFVSHDLHAVSTLCTKTLWLEKGRVKELGATASVVNSYLASFNTPEQAQPGDQLVPVSPNKPIELRKIQVNPQGKNKESLVTIHSPIQIEAEFWCSTQECEIEVKMALLTEKGVCVFEIDSPAIIAKQGILAFRSVIPANLLNNTTYYVSLLIMNHNTECIAAFDECLSFVVEDIGMGKDFLGLWSAIIRPKIEMSLSVKEPIPIKSLWRKTDNYATPNLI